MFLDCQRTLLTHQTHPQKFLDHFLKFGKSEVKKVNCDFGRIWAKTAIWPKYRIFTWNYSSRKMSFTSIRRCKNYLREPNFSKILIFLPSEISTGNKYWKSQFPRFGDLLPIEISDGNQNEIFEKFGSRR